MKHVAAGLAALAATAGSASASEADCAFHIVRHGVPIGYHIVDIEETEDGLKVDTRIEMRVKFGPLPVFRYRHVATELWRDGVLVSLSSTTNDNGEKMSLMARRESGVLMIDGTAYQGPAPVETAPSSYWNKDVVSAPTLLNTQNGALIDIAVTRTPDSTAPNGAIAERFLVVGTLELNLWYDGDRWIGSNFTIDGEELTYEPIGEESERRRLFAKLD